MSIFEFHTVYLVPFLIVSTAFVIDMFITSFGFNFRTTPQDFLRECANKKKDLNDDGIRRKFDKIYE